MSCELTKEEMYECLYVVNHVIRKIQKLGKITTTEEEREATILTK